MVAFLGLRRDEYDWYQTYRERPELGPRKGREPGLHMTLETGSVMKHDGVKMEAQVGKFVSKFDVEILVREIQIRHSRAGQNPAPILFSSFR